MLHKDLVCPAITNTVTLNFAVFNNMLTNLLDRAMSGMLVSDICEALHLLSSSMHACKLEPVCSAL